MRRRFPDTHFVLITEEDAMCATRNNFGERDWRINHLIDVLLKQQYFRGIDEPVATDVGTFQSYAMPQYAQVSHTLLSVYQLWRRAYYVETATLLRHVFEVFAQLRYFNKYPGQLKKHWLAQSQKDRVQFRIMFDDIAPDSYKAVYGMLSDFAHGNRNMMFRSEMSAPNATQPEPMQHPFMGSKFDLTNAMIMHIFFIGAALGFINYFSIFFPKNTIASDAELVQDLMDTQQWLRTIFDNQRKKATKPHLFDALEKLVIV